MPPAVAIVYIVSQLDAEYLGPPIHIIGRHIYMPTYIYIYMCIGGPILYS